MALDERSLTEPSKLRKPEAPVDSMFIERWSPRAFSQEPLSDEEISSLFEAARWAPSSYNLQPWLFLYATNGPTRETFNSILFPLNRDWAANAPLLVFLLSRITDDKGGSIPTGRFDSGAAWMSLAFQASIMGLVTHAMAGFDIDAAYEKLKIPRDRYEVECAIAAGHQGDASSLAEFLRQREQPNLRMPLNRVAFSGTFEAVSSDNLV